MSDHRFKLESSRSSSKLTQISRRNFLRQLASLGPVVPASVLLTGLAESFASQRSPLSSSTRKSGTGFEPTTGSVVTDVAARAGLGQASNAFGGVTRTRYPRADIGCGLAFFDYDHDGWLDPLPVK